MGIYYFKDTCLDFLTLDLFWRLLDEVHKPTRPTKLDLVNEVLRTGLAGPGAGFLIQNDLSHEFFARSPSIYTILPPVKVVKLCKLRENVQKTRVTGHFVLENTNYSTISRGCKSCFFHEIA